MKLIHLNKSIIDEDEVIKMCLDFLASKGGSAIANGKHLVGEEGIFVNVSEYTTCPPDAGKWEAHRQYIDFQLVLKGIEKIYVSDIGKMTSYEYNSEKDYVMCDGKAEFFYVLDRNTGILLMPEDAHKPGISMDDSVSHIKKAVFKIPLTYYENKNIRV